jgi:putative FmdB family regulatory protein
MPVYEYACSDCNRTLEVQQRMSDAPLSECPECSGKLRRLISMVNIGSAASGAPSCKTPVDPSCFTCGKAGTGCS